MIRFSLAAILTCLTLPNYLLGQEVNLQLVNFFQDFSDTQGANGITSVGLPSESGDNAPPLAFNSGISLGSGSQTFEGLGFFAPGVIPYVQQELSRQFLSLLSLIHI